MQSYVLQRPILVWKQTQPLKLSKLPRRGSMGLTVFGQNADSELVIGDNDSRMIRAKLLWFNSICKMCNENRTAWLVSSCLLTSWLLTCYVIPASTGSTGTLHCCVLQRTVSHWLSFNSTWYDIPHQMPVLGPSLIFVGGLVKLFPAVARLVCPDHLN